MKKELGGKLIIKIFRLRVKSYSYLIDDGSEDNKANGTKMCAIRRKLKFENDQNRLEATQLKGTLMQI